MELLLPFRCRCGEVVADRDREKLDTDSESTIVVALEWRWGRDRAATCRRAMCNFKCQKQQKRRTGKEKSEPEWRAGGICEGCPSAYRVVLLGRAQAAASPDLGETAIYNVFTVTLQAAVLMKTGL